MRVSKDNIQRAKAKYFKITHAKNITRRNWDSLVGSLNYAANVLPLGRLRHRRFSCLGNKAFLVKNRDKLVPISKRMNAANWTSPRIGSVRIYILDSEWTTRCGSQVHQQVGNFKIKQPVILYIHLGENYNVNPQEVNSVTCGVQLHSVCTIDDQNSFSRVGAIPTNVEQPDNGHYLTSGGPVCH